MNTSSEVNRTFTQLLKHYPSRPTNVFCRGVGCEHHSTHNDASQQLSHIITANHPVNYIGFLDHGITNPNSLRQPPPFVIASSLFHQGTQSNQSRNAYGSWWQPPSFLAATNTSHHGDLFMFFVVPTQLITLGTDGMTTAAGIHLGSEHKSW